MSKLSKWLGLVQTLAPIVLASVKGGDKIAPVVDAITSGISEAEQIPGATAAEKKAHVMTIVVNGVSAANATGKTHLNPAEVAAVASQGIDTAIATINLVHASHEPVGAGTGE